MTLQFTGRIRLQNERFLGRVGVPPAVLRILRSTRRNSLDVVTTKDVRKYSARRGTREAGRPPYPHTARLLLKNCSKDIASNPRCFGVFGMPFDGALQTHIES